MSPWMRAAACASAMGCGGSSIWLGGAEARGAVGPDAAVDASEEGIASAIDAASDISADAHDASVDADAMAAADTIGTEPDAACGPTPIVMGAKSPTHIAVDDDGVFWSEGGHAANAADPNVILQSAKDGSAKTVVVPISGVPGALALDSGNVYYVQAATPPPSGYTVLRAGKPGKPPSTRPDYARFTSPAAAPGRIAVDANANRIAWVDATTAYVMALDAAPDTWKAAAQNLAGGLQIALNGPTLWVSEQQGDVLQVDLAGTLLPAPLGGSSPSFGVAADSAHVFWTSETAVRMSDKAGGAMSTIASCGSPCDAVETDGTNVVWSTTQEIWESPIAGGSPHRIGGGYTDVRHIAIDATRVYWTDTATGTVWSACR